MITEQSRQSILALIKQMQCMSTVDKAAALPFRDFNSLRNQISELELHVRLMELEELFSSSDDLEERFIAHCRTRSFLQSMSCLSANVMPQAAGNAVYTEIAFMLFPKLSLSGLIKLLLPEATIVVTPLVEDRLFRGLVENTVEEFFSEEVASLERLADFVVWQNHLFDVRAIAHFDLNMHRYFYQMLNSNYPALAHHLYLHNSGLRQLKSHLEIAFEGLTVDESIRLLCEGLKLFQKANREEPHLNYYHKEVLLDFKHCIEGLPLETQRLVLNLKKNRTGYSLQDEIEYIEQGGGVLYAASIIEEIYEAFKGTSLLVQRIGAIEVVDSIVALYDKNPLSTQVEILTPEHFSDNITDNIWGYDQYNQMRAIYSFPPEWHELLITQSVSNAYRFDDYLKMMHWNSPLLWPILYRSFQGLTSIQFKRLIEEMIDIKFPLDYIHQMLEMIPEDKRISFICEGVGTTILHKAISYSALFVHLWKMLPEETQLSEFRKRANTSAQETFLQRVAPNAELLSFIIGEFFHRINLADELKENDKSNRSILHYVANQFDSLKGVLFLLPQAEWLDMIEQMSKYGNVLHCAATNEIALQLLLSLYGTHERRRFEAIQQKCSASGKTVFQVAAARAETLKVILALYEQEDRMTLVKEMSEKGKSSLYYSVGCPESFRIIWDLYPEEERLLALSDNTILFCSLEQSNLLNILDIIFNSLPESDYVSILSAVDRGGRNVLQHIKADTQLIKELLGLIPPALRLALMTHRDNSDNSLIFAAANNPECLSTLLELLPVTDRILAVSEMNKEGVPLLYQTLKPECLHLILSEYSERERLVQIGHLKYGRSTLIELIFGLDNEELMKNALQVILDLIPMHKRAKLFCKPYSNRLKPIIDNPEMFDFITQLIPESDVLQFFNSPEELDKVSLPQYMKDYINEQLVSRLTFESFGVEYTLDIDDLSKIEAISDEAYSCLEHLHACCMKMPLDDKQLQGEIQEVVMTLGWVILSLSPYQDIAIKVLEYYRANLESMVLDFIKFMIEEQAIKEGTFASMINPDEDAELFAIETTHLALIKLSLFAASNIETNSNEPAAPSP